MIEREQEDFVPVIKLPEDKKEILESKLKGYRGRLQQRLTPVQRLDTRYKAEILQTLLEKGSVNTRRLSIKIWERNHHAYEPGIFENACNIINDYVETGGMNTRGGRGLPRVERRTE